MNHGHYGATADIRYRRDIVDGVVVGEWYRRCPDCQKADRQCWWPLDLAFWNPRSLQQCRSCFAARKARVDRERRWANPNAKSIYMAEYLRRNRTEINRKRRERRARRAA